MLARHAKNTKFYGVCAKLPKRPSTDKAEPFSKKALGSEFTIIFLPHVQQVLLLSNFLGKTVYADTIQGRLLKKLSLLDAKFQTQYGCIGGVN